MPSTRSGTRCRARVRAFSLIELVIVVVIIGLIAAIAIPRITRGGDAAAESAFVDNLAALRRAIEFYHAEHGRYPTCDDAGGGNTTIMLQLTQYTDENGNHSPTKSQRYSFGPYLRSIPRPMLGPHKDHTKIDTVTATLVAWIYHPTTGEIYGNTDTAMNREGTRMYKTF